MKESGLKALINHIWKTDEYSLNLMLNQLSSKTEK